MSKVHSALFLGWFGVGVWLLFEMLFDKKCFWRLSATLEQVVGRKLLFFSPSSRVLNIKSSFVGNLMLLLFLAKVLLTKPTQQRWGAVFRGRGLELENLTHFDSFADCQLLIGINFYQLRKHFSTGRLEDSCSCLAGTLIIAWRPHLPSCTFPLITFAKHFAHLSDSTRRRPDCSRSRSR